MKEEKLMIKNIPAIILGNPSKSVCLYVHGQGGNKEEVLNYVDILNSHSWQTISIDLPGHGERKVEKAFDPWHTIPDLLSTMDYMKKRWTNFALLANSIGAWFSMMAFQRVDFQKALFVSPVLDMPALIFKMMSWAAVSEEELKKQSTIQTTFGQTLSWEYLQYAQSHSTKDWCVPTQILYGGKDELIDKNTVDSFIKGHNCKLTIMKNGKHWFHAQEQLDVLTGWLDTCFQNAPRYKKNECNHGVSKE